jgi:hypothetical protein
VAEDKLATGIGRPADKQWKTKATALPPDGGAPGKALLDRIARRAEAYKNADFASLIALGGLRAKFVYAERSDTGAPVSRQSRLLALRGQYLEDFAQANVLGGYRLGDTAALIVDGRDGAGWIVRGIVLMELRDGVWSDADGRRTIEIPPS